MGRMIDADKLIRKAQRVAVEAWKMKTTAPIETILNQFIDWIRSAPTIDAVEVVRCYECKHRIYCYSEVAMTNKSQTADIYKSVNFCSYGERKETDHE